MEPPKNSSVISEGHLYEHLISRKGSKYTENEELADFFFNRLSRSGEQKDELLLSALFKWPGLDVSLVMESFLDGHEKSKSLERPRQE